MPRKSREQRIFECIEWSAVEREIGEHGVSQSGLYTFKFPDKKDELCERIISVFNIENPELFRIKFNEAVSGDGDEAKKMTSIKSSSLCALLCFYNISKNGRHIVIGNTEYTNSYFEVKNQVFNNPSNMDVVLTSDSGEILFVECKFSEYLSTSPIEISAAYEDNEISGKIYRKASKILYKNEEGKYESKDSYVGGLKQIISHYVGLLNFKGKGNDYMSGYNQAERIRNDIHKGTFKKISFIEVVYKLNDSELVKYFDSYHSKSKELIQILKEQNDGIDFLEPTSYQKAFESNQSVLDKTVKEFYKL